MILQSDVQLNLKKTPPIGGLHAGVDSYLATGVCLCVREHVLQFILLFEESPDKIPKSANTF